MNHQTFYMADYKRMEMPVLLELLTEHTEIYTRLLAEKNYTIAYEESKGIIKSIQQEINERNNTLKTAQF